MNRLAYIEVWLCDIKRRQEEFLHYFCLQNTISRPRWDCEWSSSAGPAERGGDFRASNLPPSTEGERDALRRPPCALGPQAPTWALSRRVHSVVSGCGASYAIVSGGAAGLTTLLRLVDLPIDVINRERCHFDRDRPAGPTHHHHLSVVCETPAP
jgi:hypothetical protein